MIKYIWRNFNRTEPINPETGFWRLFRDEKPVGEFDSEQKIVIDRFVHDCGFRRAEIQTDLGTYVDTTSAQA